MLATVEANCFLRLLGILDERLVHEPEAKIGERKPEKTPTAV